MATHKKIASSFLVVFLFGFLASASFSSNVPFFLDSRNGRGEPGPDACADFYGHACAGWGSGKSRPAFEPFWNPWTAAGHETANRLLRLLQDGDGDGDATTAPKIFYEACARTGAPEARYLRSLKMLVENFIGNPRPSGAAHQQEYQWVLEIVKITKLLGIHPMLKLHVDIDYENTTQHTLYIEPGDLVFPEQILATPYRHPAEVETYEIWIMRTIRHLYPDLTSEDVEDDLRRAIRDIIAFEIRLAKFATVPSRDRRLSLAELYQRLPMNWMKALGVLFDGTAGNASLLESDRVIVRNFGYLKNLYDLLGKVEVRVIADYLIWHVIKDLSRETTQTMRDLNFLVDRAILGVRSDIPRPIECVHKTAQFFNFALIRQYVERHVTSETLAAVEGMVKAVQSEFVSAIEASQWLSAEARRLSVEKVRRIRHSVGFPDWVRDGAAVDEYYKELKMTNNHFLNVLKAKNFLVEKRLARFKEEVSEIEWPTTVFDSNAYYSILQNAIFIPLGLLLPPFFDDRRPRAQNFGALGTLIGHELSHALDTSGRKADKAGNIRKWWPSADIAAYQSRADCFRRQNERNNDSSGAAAVGESIADTLGLQLSLRAMRKTALKARSRELFEGQDRERDFYKSFAQMWCEISDKSDLFSEEAHAPVQDRVRGSLQNSEDFRRTFGCPSNTSAQKCSLW